MMRDRHGRVETGSGMRKEFKVLTVAERELKRGECERASGQRDSRVDVMDRGRRTGGRLGKANEWWTIGN